MKFIIVVSLLIALNLNALSVREILGLDMAALVRDGKTDQEITNIAQTKYDRLKSAGISDGDIKLLAKRTYRSEKEYTERVRALSH